MNDQSFVVAAKIGSSKNKTKPQTWNLRFNQTQPNLVRFLNVRETSFCKKKKSFLGLMLASGWSTGGFAFDFFLLKWNGS